MTVHKEQYFVIINRVDISSIQSAMLNGVLVQLIHAKITREGTCLAVLLPLTCEVLTHLVLYISACAALAFIQSSSSLAQITLSFHALRGNLFLPAIPP